MAKSERIPALLIGIVLICVTVEAATVHQISQFELRDVGNKGDSDDTSGNSDGDFVVNNNGVPHRHWSQQTENTDEPDVGEHVPEKQRLKEIQKIVDDFFRRNPDTPPIDTEALLDFSDAEILAMLNRISPSHKRFVEKDESERWTLGYVPFIYKSSITPNMQKEIEIAMRRMEKYTCIRFVPWEETTTRETYNLDHDGHLNFYDGDGCSATQGNSRKLSGQGISCCSRGTCLHELGHSLGVFHEQQNPQAEGWIRINWENIKKDYWSQYKPINPDNVKLYNYDITSIMHYSTGAFNSNGGKTMTLLFPELSIIDNIFYQFYEIVESHDCKGLNCSDFATTCENDGYVTLISDVCNCMCPYGLDRTTGCTTTITQDPTPNSWPGGSYAMLSPIDGCPGNAVFAEGEVTHWSRGGSYNSDSFHLKGGFLSESTNIHFCVMENSGNQAKWSPGSYCIHRVGDQCPEDFEEGYIQFDDVIRSQTENNTNSGTLPDGDYDIDTRFYFCCRDDGFGLEPMEIPNQDPLVLYRYNDDCHPIRGMFFTEEYYYFYNYNGEDTIVATSGAHPKLYKSSSKKYKTYFCYYKPYNMDCGGVIDLDSTNPSAIITSPNYPNPYDDAMECNWLIKAPENSTILLNFDDMEIEEVSETCMDSLEIRHSRLGQPGLKYCGDGMKESVRSIFNKVSMSFRSNLAVTKRGFNVTASYIAPEDHCYDLDDGGKTYRGKVNFTRDMQPCLPWATTTSCPYSALNERYFNDGLDGNYCRNPGDGLRPWCYTGYSEKQGCLRNYCDVCLKENIYDTIDNCEELKVNDNFCDEDPQAFSGCAKTCAASFPELPTIGKASDVTCTAPAIPSDGVLMSADQCTYKVGETVEVRCSSSNDTVTATCLTDGSWNLGNYICGVCPTDWVPHNGKCFKFFYEDLNHGDATARCAEFGGIIAPAETQEELDFILSLKLFMQKMWLGADDKTTEGTWKWQDGTPVNWTNWADDEPDNRSGEDCAYVNRDNKDNTWKDTYCSTYFTNFVCRSEVAESTTCKDRQDDCRDIFETNPKSCQEHPDFARQECPSTCGLCTATSCPIPTASANTDEVTTHTGETISTGDFISYECADRHILTGGNLDRGCAIDGQMTGEAPVCTSEDLLVSPNNNVDLKSRSYVGSTRYVYTGPMPEFNITRSGEITEWRFYTKYVGNVALQVWRQIDVDSYTFIGQNVIVTEDDRVQTVMVAQGERIQVEVGDSIGVYFASGKGGICYNYSCDDADGEAIKSAGSISDTSSFVPNTAYSFSSSSLRCRVFSVTAMIGPAQA